MPGVSLRVRRLEYLVPLVILATLVAGALFFAIRSARRAAWRATRANCLKDIGCSLHNWNDSIKHLPAAVRRDKSGQPLSSWRFQLLPYMEAMMIEMDYRASWTDPVNSRLVSSPYSGYCFSERGDSAERLETNVVAITGPGTPLDGDQECRIEDLDWDTILVVEIAESAIHWAEPGDLHIDEIPESITAGLDGDGVHVLLATGEVWFLRRDVPLEDLKKFFTIDGAKKYDGEILLAPYADRR